MKALFAGWMMVLPLAIGPGWARGQSVTFPVVQTETAYLDICEQGWIQREPASAPWARGDCEVKWRWALAAGPMADAILVLSVTEGDAARAPEDMAALLSGSEGGDGVVVTVRTEAIRFDWQEAGSEGRFNVIGALGSRGVVLQSLGCPEYPGASLGQEKVMLAAFEDRKPFVLTVYSRAAPTGFETGVYEVDADFSGVVPDMEALRAGRYPGGGGRALAVDPTGWVAECADPA